MLSKPIKKVQLLDYNYHYFESDGTAYYEKTFPLTDKQKELAMNLFVEWLLFNNSKSKAD